MDTFKHSTSLITLIFLVVLQIFSVEFSLGSQNSGKEIHAEPFEGDAPDDKSGFEPGVTSEYAQQYVFCIKSERHLDTESATCQETIALLQAIRAPPIGFITVLQATQHFKEAYYETA